MNTEFAMVCKSVALYSEACRTVASEATAKYQKQEGKLRRLMKQKMLSKAGKAKTKDKITRTKDKMKALGESLLMQLVSEMSRAGGHMGRAICYVAEGGQ